MNKKRDDEFINKREPHEIKYILSLYDEKYHDVVLRVLETCKRYTRHKDFYKLLEEKFGIYRL